MSESYKCPFCGVTIPIIGSTHGWINVFFDSERGMLPNTSLDSRKKIPVTWEHPSNNEDSDSRIGIEMIRCPSCGQIVLNAFGIGEVFRNKQFRIHPRSTHENFPDYVPKHIKSCYEQACDVLELSPMASGTLFRKTLEGIVDDFYNEEIKKSNNKRKDRLFDKLNIIEENHPNSELIKASQSLRKTGNITAHFSMDKNQMPEDVDQYEAKALKKFIELMIRKTYIQNHDDNETISDINEIANEKEKNKSKN